MATASRAIWKGAISFGLVHVPVSLHSATIESGIDFDWLDRRSLDPVGYKRVNKKTRKEVAKEDIVKGIALEDDRYVVLSDAEIRTAYPVSTQSIDIEGFVGAGEIPFVYLDRPYYLAPLAKGAKVYALLREALLATQRIGVARVVIQTKQHLAALVPSGPALVLNLLRWGNEIRPWDGLKLPAAGTKAAGLGERELTMARQLVEDMTMPWKADDYHDSFAEQVMALVRKKAEAGETEAVQPQEPVASTKSADIIDLTELLQRSLRKGGDANGAKASAKAPGRKPPAKAKVPAKAARHRKRAA